MKRQFQIRVSWPERMEFQVRVKINPSIFPSEISPANGGRAFAPARLYCPAFEEIQRGGGWESGVLDSGRAATPALFMPASTNW